MKANKPRIFGSIGIILPVLILLIVGWLRLSRTSQLGYFMMDEERDAFLVRRMLVDRRPLLIGGAIPGGVNVGPLFFYISMIPYALSNLNPIGPAYAAGIIGALSVGLVWIVGKRLFGKRAALLATILSGFSLLNVIYHRPWWPLTLSQLVTLTAYFALWQLTLKRSILFKKDTPLQAKWWWALVGALVVGAQSDPSTLSLIPLSVIWLWLMRKKSGINQGMILKAVGLFLLAHATWFAFELRHNFLNTRAIIKLFSGTGSGESMVSIVMGIMTVMKMTAGMLYRLFIPTGPLDVTGQINPAEIFLSARMGEIWWPGAWLLLGLVFTYVIRSLLLKRSTIVHGFNSFEVGRKLVSLHLVISLGGMFLYTGLFPGYVHEWMWAFMFPAFFLIVADLIIITLEWLIDHVFGVVRNLLLVTCYLLLATWIFWQISLFTKLENMGGLGKKLEVVRGAQAEITGRPYELRSSGELRYGGWRYLFTLYGEAPLKSYMDYVYQDWLYPKSDTQPEVAVTVSNQTNGKMEYKITSD